MRKIPLVNVEKRYRIEKSGSVFWLVRKRWAFGRRPWTARFWTTSTGSPRL
jgi:hypothetical protein